MRDVDGRVRLAITALGRRIDGPELFSVYTIGGNQLLSDDQTA
jgi:hypothetical protein